VELWEKDNIIPILKKGKEQDSGNSQPLTSVPGKILLNYPLQIPLQMLDPAWGNS